MRVALVLGSASTLWDDVRAASELGAFHGGVAANDAGVAWPWPLDGWVTYHPEFLGRFTLQRTERGLPDHRRIFIHPSGVAVKKGDAEFEVVESFFPGQTASGSSTLFALKVALVDLGFDRAVICGAPLDGSGGHLRPDQGVWHSSDAYQVGWREALPHIRGRARSMSGFTKALLGAPTPEWMEGDQ